MLQPGVPRGVWESAASLFRDTSASQTQRSSPRAWSTWSHWERGVTGVEMKDEKWDWFCVTGRAWLQGLGHKGMSP